MAKAKVLTDLNVRHAKPKRRKGVLVVNEIPDGGCRGLYLLVRGTGHRVWTVRYRFAGRSRKPTLGNAIAVSKGESVPEHALTLALARSKAAEALHKVALGADPRTEKLQQKIEKRSEHDDTFKAIATNCFHRERHLRSAASQLGNLQRLVFPELGHRPVGSIRRSEVV